MAASPLPVPKRKCRGLDVAVMHGKKGEWLRYYAVIFGVEVDNLHASTRRADISARRGFTLPRADPSSIVAATVVIMEMLGATKRERLRNHQISRFRGKNRGSEKEQKRKKKRTGE